MPQHDTCCGRGGRPIAGLWAPSARRGSGRRGTLKRRSWKRPGVGLLAGVSTEYPGDASRNLIVHYVPGSCPECNDRYPSRYARFTLKLKVISADPYHRQFCTAVARVLRPGCRVPNRAETRRLQRYVRTPPEVITRSTLRYVAYRCGPRAEWQGGDRDGDKPWHRLGVCRLAAGPGR